MTNEEFDGGPLSPPTQEEMCARYKASYEELAEMIRKLHNKAAELGYEGLWPAMQALAELRAKGQGVGVPSGWKPVPAEPTPEMCEAFAVSVKAAGWPLSIFELVDDAPIVFKAMLAAMPEQPK